MNRKECSLGYFEWEDSRLLIFTVTNLNPDVTNIQDYHHTYQEIMDDKEGPFILLFDATKGKWLSPKERGELGKVTKEAEVKYEGRLLKRYIVIPNPVVKVIIKGVNILSNHKVAQELFTTREAAYQSAMEEISTWNLVETKG